MRLHLRDWIALLCLCAPTAPVVAAQETPQAPQKQLPLPGETFRIQGHSAFAIVPARGPASQARQAWALYAPTLRGLPSKAETWMFKRFLARGVAIAGIDVGESYGSPAGRALYRALHDELSRRGFAKRCALLARSRGGLMLYNWAAENAERVACIAGIYPVCDLRSYPGLAKAHRAFGMSAAELGESLSEHNPVERLQALVQAKIPVFHMHGDKDRIVPYEANSAALHARYTELGGNMVLETIAGGGHDMQRHWFESQDLVDFVITHARAAASGGTTKGLIDPEDSAKPIDAVQLVGPKGSQLVPDTKNGEGRWTFAKGVLTASPAWDSVRTRKAYRDFRMHVEFNVNARKDVQGKPEKNGNSGVYLQKRYEIQILNSFAVPAEAYKASFGGSLYRLKKPDQLANKKAGEWQSYDIAFRAARFDGKKKSANARITVYQNGTRIHDDFSIPRKTGAGQKEGPAPGPIMLQGHQNRVRFRNVWIQELNLDASSTAK